MQALSFSKASLTIFIALAVALTAAIHLYAETDPIRRDEKTPQKTNDMDRHQNRKKRQRKIRKKSGTSNKIAPIKVGDKYHHRAGCLSS